MSVGLPRDLVGYLYGRGRVVRKVLVGQGRVVLKAPVGVLACLLAPLDQDGAHLEGVHLSRHSQHCLHFPISRPGQLEEVEIAQ